ncbi:MAG: flagellar biosynthesis protein FlhB [Comamonadaceae bacterium]|nr:flagellar biosynthesis protein FlhB [Comamonadaceae bacterium]
MSDSAQDKTLPATPQRLKKARDDGQVARSKDLLNLAVLGAGSAVLMLALPWAFGLLRDGLRGQLRFDRAAVVAPEVGLQRAADAFGQGLLLYLPLGVLLLVLVLAVAFASGSWTLTTKPITPDLSRINPLSGFGRLFSKQQLVETAKLSVITLIVGVVGWQFLSSHLGDFSSLVMQPLESGLGQLGRWMMAGVAGLMVTVAVVAAIDFPTQKFLHKQQLRMSHDEVKREHKESEGDPQMKGRRRARAREIAQRMSIKAVPKADLVVMNPTHYAVALRYDEATMAAPRVIAKGSDLLALKIRDVAKDAQVPVLQSPMLARALYAHAEIDQEIPSALYTAVAQVLAYVYQLKAALRGEGVMPAEPVPQVPQELDPHYRKPVAPSA